MAVLVPVLGAVVSALRRVVASPLGRLRRLRPATGPGRHTSLPVPYAALLVPLAVYAACLLAAATSLPLLRRSIRPAELRYA